MICKNPGGVHPPLISLRGGGNGLPPPLETAYDHILTSLITFLKLQPVFWKMTFYLLQYCNVEKIMFNL